MSGHPAFSDKRHGAFHGVLLLERLKGFRAKRHLRGDVR